VRMAIPSPLPACPCEGRDPSPSGEGTRGLGVRAGPLNQAPGAGASAAARAARRRERSEPVPVGAAFSVPFLAGQKGDTPFKEPAPTVDPGSHLPTLSLPLQGGDSGSTETIDKSQNPQTASVKRRKRKPTAQT
jgi:hypothetical protein